MGTLTAQGILWGYLSHNGKVAFSHGDHAIHFEPNTGYYHLKENGHTVFVAKRASECLENAPEAIFDYYASQLTPSWESDHGTEDQATSAA